MVGSTKSTDGDFSDRMTDDWDLFLIKLDQQGEVTWIKTYGGSGDDFGFIKFCPKGMDLFNSFFAFMFFSFIFFKVKKGGFIGFKKWL